MNEIIKSYIGKKCIISLSGGFDSQVIGEIKEVADNWLTVVSDKGVAESLNVDYISRIKEAPEKKKKKNKSEIA